MEFNALLDNTAANRVGLIGWPVGHSISPLIHHAAFAATGLDNWEYQLLAVPPTRLGESIERLSADGYIGLNVTIPHKYDIVTFLDRLTGPAQVIGAVNTVDLRTRTGFNTDLTGFMTDLAAHGVEVTGKKVLVYGAGGAARAAVYGLVQAGADVVVVNRSRSKAEQLSADYSPRRVIVLAPDQVVWTALTLVVNCTSLGMWPETQGCPWPAPLPCLRDIIAYDMVYRPCMTTFLRRAAVAGARIISGWGMLVGQAARSFEIWTGIQAPIKIMHQAAERALTSIFVT